VTTGTGSDDLTTGAGNDTINPGQGGNDGADGETGSDTLIADFSLSVGLVSDGTPNGDMANGYFGSFAGGGRTLTYAGIENFQVIGSFSSDDITTGGGDDIINPGQGGKNDVVAAGAGNDTLIADFSQSAAAVTGINDLTGTLDAGYGGNFSDLDRSRTIIFAGIENFQVTGGSGDDTITTGDGADVLTGGAGMDTLHAGLGDDDLFVNPGDVVAGETYDGGDGTDAIYAGGIVDFTGTTITSIEELEFGVSVASGATFTSDQIGGGGLSSSLAVEGDAQKNQITINMTAAGTLDLSGWTFTNWSPTDPNAPDYVQIDGSAGDDTIIGTKNAAGGDRIDGGTGNDRLVLDYSGVAGGVSGGVN
ncbi:MAG TPA: calcium-binding protein, partial [Thermomicrobiales bacterium]|nr:calcium-binding protein [Thermomicrobiales bacterium]